MQEQERLANEEVEKRLKATLTAKTKREAGASASRVASPAVGTPSTSETPEPKANAEEAESTMEVDSSTVNASSKENENVGFLCCHVCCVNNLSAIESLGSRISEAV